jgi:acetyl esterase/lipase
MLRFLPVVVALLVTLGEPLAAQRGATRPPFDLPLYAGNAPGAPRSVRPEFTEPPKAGGVMIMSHVQDPDVRVFLPPAARNTGAAVVIMPGGGYGILAIDHEGYQVARWLNGIGVAAIVCKYRVSAKDPGTYRYPVPLLDARQAMRITREHAAAWGIDPTRVGVLGFSAGGHLASMVATMASEPLPDEQRSPQQSMAHRADFAVLVYPVISLHAPFAHRGSGDNLLGAQATDSLRRAYSTELRVTKQTPPTFLVATQDDDAVPARNAMAFYDAMITNGVPGELHIWQKGGHGFGMITPGAPVAGEWLPKVRDWMRGRGLLTRPR